tara:strand:+ start:875 stop:1234 length:360 start_codon:yes stop_codon:yes gene_type:complete
MARSNSVREIVLRGEMPAVHPVQHALLQLWVAWRKAEADINPGGKQPGLDQFAAAVGTTVRRASRLLRGNYPPHRMPYGSIETWTRNLQSHWTSRGLALQLWTVRRPDGRYSMTVRGRV